MTLTGTRLERLLKYDPETGIFTWRGGHKRVVPGGVAGAYDKDGYIGICIDQKMYKAHRLAWVWMTGQWPINEMDHINLNKADNRFINLREATKRQNMQNTACRSNNKFGLKGACFDKRKNKYYSRIKDGKHYRFLGYFDTAHEAHLAYARAALATYGEYGRAR